MTNNIHSTAIIKNGAKIDPSVTIGPFSIIGANVSIGEGTTISSHCVIDGLTSIGKYNKIFSHSVLGTIPQDLKYDGEDTKLIIGDNNTIREHTLVNTGTAGGGGITSIGDNCLLMGHVHLGHDCILENNIVVANSTAIAGHVQIQSDVVVGGMSAIHQFCKIGEHSMIGGGSILVQDIPPYCICEGNRANIRALNINGLRRRFDKEDINELKKAYKTIFSTTNSISDNGKKLLETTTNNYVKNLCSFVINTKRGIPFIRKQND
jgi:UDP-N-acetylglucosamine acyltransferase